MAGKKRKKIYFYSPKRRAIYARGDKIDHLTLYEMHDWTCNICSEKIDKRLRLPNLRAATIDHVVPLSRGGTHTWDNCRPAHADCNFKRGNSLLTEPLAV